MSTKHGKEEKRRPVIAALATLGLTAATIAALAVPASGAETTATFTLDSGELAISASPNATLDTGGLTLTGLAGGTAVGQIPEVKVTDARAQLLGAWEASVHSTAFTPDVVGAPAIPAANVQYWSGPQTSLALDLVIPGQLTELEKQAIGTSVKAFSKSGGIGSSTVTWSPTVIVNIPADAVAATYTGTVTHSVL